MFRIVPAHSNQIKDTESVQRRAARFLKNKYSITPGTVTKILTDMKWPTLRKEGKLHDSQ